MCLRFIRRLTLLLTSQRYFYHNRWHSGQTIRILFHHWPWFFGWSILRCTSPPWHTRNLFFIWNLNSNRYKSCVLTAGFLVFHCSQIRNKRITWWWVSTHVFCADLICCRCLSRFYELFGCLSHKVFSSFACLISIRVRAGSLLVGLAGVSIVGSCCSLAIFVGFFSGILFLFRGVLLALIRLIEFEISIYSTKCLSMVIKPWTRRRRSLRLCRQ